MKVNNKFIKFPPKTPVQRLVVEIFFLIVFIILFGIFGGKAQTDVLYTIIITISCIATIIIRFILVNVAGDWLFFILGVVFGGGNDFMSMINGVYYYTAIPIIPNLALPIFMWLFWGWAFLLFRKIFNLAWCRGEKFQKDGRFLRGWIDTKLIFDIALVIVLRLVIYNTYLLDFWIPALFYGIAVGIRLLIFHPKKNELRIIIFLPIAYFFEGIMVLFGLYVYYNPIFPGIPLWLMIWWVLLVPIVLKEIFDRLEFIVENRQKNREDNTSNNGS